MNKESGSISVIVAGVLGFFFVMSMVFGLWAFTSRQDYKNNVDEKIADASAVAVLEAESAKDAEFIEKEKSPVRTYTGPATFGSLTFAYPKTWSVYAIEQASGTVLDLFANPGVVPGVKNDQTYALRAEIVSQSYDAVIKTYENDIKTGAVKATAYRPEKVPSVLGLRLDGEIDNNTQGAAVVLPLRDRTIKIYTEIPQFVGDFNTIVLPSVTFVP